MLALAGGDLEAARRWADQVDDSFWRGVSAARVHLASGDRAAALAALETAVPRCVRHEVVLALLKARAVADRDEAMKCAAAAVELASGDGLLQTVAVGGRRDHRAGRAGRVARPGGVARPPAASRRRRHGTARRPPVRA